jgi:type IV secretion system protein VirB4
VVCELDLKGFDFELEVISGRTQQVEAVRSLIQQVGDDPVDWLPLFQQQRLPLAKKLSPTKGEIA